MIARPMVPGNSRRRRGRRGDCDATTMDAGEAPVMKARRRDRTTRSSVPRIFLAAVGIHEDSPFSWRKVTCEWVDHIMELLALRDKVKLREVLDDL